MNYKYSKSSPSDAGRRSNLPAKKKHLRRAVFVLILVFAALAVLCAVLAAVNASLAKKRRDALGAPNHASSASMTLEGKSYINYYEPDYDADIFADADYLALNRTLKYVIPDDTSSVSLVLDEYEQSELTEGQRFFVRYFDALTHGDSDAYHTMFTDEYVAEPNGFEKYPAERTFPMQRVYDVTVTELARTVPGDEAYVYNGKPAVFGVYEVRYKILKNDGELRYDLPEGGEVPMIFELTTTDVGTADECTRIAALYRYADIAAQNK